MSDYITVLPAKGTWVVRARGAVLAESHSALELREGDYPPVIYFPRADIAMAMLDRTDKQSSCPHKGNANYFSVAAPDATIENGAWTYEDPIDQVASIKDHIAFYASDDVLVEQL